MPRFVPLLVLASLVAAEPKDLRPRYGNGFAGFGVGSSIRMKLTTVREGRVPTVTITTSTLKKVEKDALTIEYVSDNALTKPTTTSSKVPPSGNAGPLEKETVKKLEDETIEAAGREWPCTKREHTVTGPSGKRVITEWIAKDPLLRVKSLTKRYDTEGKSAGSASTILTTAPTGKDVGGKTVICAEYRTIDKQGEIEQRWETWSSRGVPGDLAGGEMKVFYKGKLAQTQHFKVLEFEVK